MSATTTTTTALQRVCFTGRLISMSRREAVDLVRERGGTVTTTVSRRTSMLVVGMGGWPLLADGSVSQQLRRAETMRDEGAPIQILSESTFLETLGLRDSSPRTGRSYSLDQVADLLGLPASTVQRWETLGLVDSEDGSYDFQDIVSLRAIADLISRGVPPTVISRSVHRLSSIIRDVARPLAQLKLVAESGAVLAELDDGLVAPDGQMVINYGDEEQPPSAESYGLDAADTGPADPDEWFEQALRYEEEDELGPAASAYRRALALRPGFAEAHFNLGNVLRAMNRIGGAEEHYRLALGQDPHWAAAWYNLADVLESDDRIEDAVDSLREALGVDPDFADAHYNLASCCEELAYHEDARRHWQAYLRLDPVGPWADRARRRLAMG